MKIITKLILVSGTLFTVVLLFEKFHGNVTESEARNMAEKNFLKICANFDIGQHDFFGPTVSNGEGFPYEFEWANKSEGDGILIIVDEQGVMNASFLPK
jgi:hypothetical protein